MKTSQSLQVPVRLPRRQVLRSPERRRPQLNVRPRPGLNVRPRPGLNRGLQWKGVWKWQHLTCMSPSLQEDATGIS